MTHIRDITADTPEEEAIKIIEDWCERNYCSVLAIALEYVAEEGMAEGSTRLLDWIGYDGWDTMFAAGFENEDWRTKYACAYWDSLCKADGVTWGDDVKAEVDPDGRWARYVAKYSA